MHTFQPDVYGINQACYYSALDEWHITLRNADLSKMASYGWETVSQVERGCERWCGSKVKRKKKKKMHMYDVHKPGVFFKDDLSPLKERNKNVWYRSK